MDGWADSGVNVLIGFTRCLDFCDFKYIVWPLPNVLNFLENAFYIDLNTGATNDICKMSTTIIFYIEEFLARYH